MQTVPRPNSGMSSEERQRARVSLLDAVNSAEAEYFHARDRYEESRRETTTRVNTRDEKKRELKKAEDALRLWLCTSEDRSSSGE